MTSDVPLASAYYLLGANFQHSAQLLLDSIEMNKKGIPEKYDAIPFYFLISHAAKLYLKEALLKRDFSASELKKYDYRHNLKALLEALQKKGVSVTPDTITLINGLHSQHLSHALRYTVFVDNGEKTFMPSLPWTFPQDLLDRAAMQMPYRRVT